MSDQYTDLLVKNLCSVVELNTQITYYLASADTNNKDFVTIVQNKEGEKIFHFAHVLGIPCKAKEARTIAQGQNKPPADTRERLLQNIRNIYDYVRVASQTEQFGMGFLMHINKLFLEDVKDVWDIGKLILSTDKDTHEYNPFPTFSTIPASDAPRFVKTVDEIGASSLPSLLSAAKMFYAFATASVFASGNGACALSILMFQLQKDQITRYIDIAGVVEECKQSMNTSESEWIDLFFNALVQELLSLRSSLVSFAELVKPVSHTYIDLSSRQIRGMRFIQEKGSISRELYAKLTSISSITAYRDLTDMLQKGYVHTIGIGKGTRYAM